MGKFCLLVELHREGLRLQPAQLACSMVSPVPLARRRKQGEFGGQAAGLVLIGQ